jgi:Ca-activated chloride channel family protein
VQYQLVTDETNFILVHERTADEKALEMPEAHQVAQMLPAGWGAAGSVRSSKSSSKISYSMSVPDPAPYVQSTVQCMSHATPDYGSMAVPSVWRTNRTAAASRVDALSSGGMDDYEIPAFLRKQVDDEPPRRDYGGPDASGITPAEFSDWLVAHTPSRWPHTYSELLNIGLGLALCEWLEFEIGVGEDEAAVVSAFIAVLQSFGFTTGRGVSKAISAIKGIIQPEKPTPPDSQLGTFVRAALQGLQASKWPESLLNFPQAQEA